MRFIILPVMLSIMDQALFKKIDAVYSFLGLPSVFQSPGALAGQSTPCLLPPGYLQVLAVWGPSRLEVTTPGAPLLSHTGPERQKCGIELETWRSFLLSERHLAFNRDGIEILQISAFFKLIGNL